MTAKQDRRSPKIDVHTSPIAGKGMFANADIEVGEKIIVWGGNYTDKIGADEARKKDMLVMQWDDNLYSYEVRGTDDGYFINHSCDPNVWMTDAFTLVAKRDIKPGEEITADYAMWDTDGLHVHEWKCKCGSPLCRGQVTGNDWKNRELQIRYKDHFSPLLNKRILGLVYDA